MPSGGWDAPMLDGLFVFFWGGSVVPVTACFCASPAAVGVFFLFSHRGLVAEHGLFVRERKALVCLLADSDACCLRIAALTFLCGRFFGPLPLPRRPPAEANRFLCLRTASSMVGYNAGRGHLEYGTRDSTEAFLNRALLVELSIYKVLYVHQVLIVTIIYFFPFTDEVTCKL